MSALLQERRHISLRGLLLGEPRWSKEHPSSIFAVTSVSCISWPIPGARARIDSRN